MAHICNLSFVTGVVPDSLKLAKVIPVYKKGDKSQPGNYRPISLLSVFDKVLEKLICKRLCDFLQFHNILYKFQFGFRKHHSTVLAIMEVIDNIYQHLDVHEFTLGVYLDLQKAFDTVNHEILLYKLNNFDVRGVVLNPLKPSVIMWSHFEYSAPYRPKLPSLISDIRALGRSGLSARVPECQK